MQIDLTRCVQANLMAARRAERPKGAGVGVVRCLGTLAVADQYGGQLCRYPGWFGLPIVRLTCNSPRRLLEDGCTEWR